MQTIFRWTPVRELESLPGLPLLCKQSDHASTHAEKVNYYNSNFN